MLLSLSSDDGEVDVASLYVLGRGHDRFSFLLFALRFLFLGRRALSRCGMSFPKRAS